MTFVQNCNTIDRLAKTIISRLQDTPDGERLLIGIAGYPGSGKSTIAYPLTERINELLQDNTKNGEWDGEGSDKTSESSKGGEEHALCVGMDGWHYPQSYLAAHEESEMMFARRGAHFTFDGHLFSTFVSKLRKVSQGGPVLGFPAFSHAAKDPYDSGMSVQEHHRVVIIEGLYCFLNVAPWSHVGALLDERIWVDVDRDVARERLIARHLRDGVETTPEAAARRADHSDLLNGDFLRANLLEPTIVIQG